MVLSTRRGLFEGGPIPISLEAIWCYVDLCLSHWSGDEVEDLLYYLRVLDDKYLEIQNKKLDQLRKRNQGSDRG